MRAHSLCQHSSIFIRCAEITARDIYQAAVERKGEVKGKESNTNKLLRQAGRRHHRRFDFFFHLKSEIL